MCLGVTLAGNYCDPKLCGRNVKHLACNNTGNFGPACPDDAKVFTLTADHINTFLDAHNKNRAIIASGSLPGYKSATNMSVVVSDFYFKQLYTEKNILAVPAKWKIANI
jgi:hypothetical protein